MTTISPSGCGFTIGSLMTRRLAWALVATSMLTAPGWATAQTAPNAAAASQSYTLHIPSGGLETALVQFANATGLQLIYSPELTRGLSSSGLDGRTTAGAGLAQLLGGTGLTYRIVNAKTVVIEKPIPGARTLGAVQVEGMQAQGFTALNGFGAGAGSNGGSDPTATEGTGSLTTNGANVASKTPQGLKDTPQSVTVMTQERIQQQNLTDLTSALEYTPGVTNVEVNSIQTTFYSRGFQISTFQIDGGAPLDNGYNSNYKTTPNLAEFDDVQILRGSDALFGGAGQPGGVVNLARKRPLDHEQFTGDLSVGSWDNERVQGDITGPIGFDGHLRARLVVSDQDRDFFYDRAHQNKAFIYGVVEGDVGPNTVVRAGFSYEHQHNTGWDFDGLPRYSDGADIGLSRSTSLNASWSRWGISTPEFFAAIEHKFNPNWGVKLNFTGLSQDSTQVYNFNGGFIIRGDPSASNFGEEAFERVDFHSSQYAFDATLNGEFQLFGLKQTLVIGSDYSITSNRYTTYYSYFPVAVPISAFSFDASSLNPEPVTPQKSSYVPSVQSQVAGYMTMNLQPVRNLHVMAGFRLSGYWNKDGEDFYYQSSTPFYTYASKNDSTEIVTPYAAATYSLTPEISLYASYADIFQAQGYALSPTGQTLAPVTGVTYETGVKGAFEGGKLNASLAVYYTDASNQAAPYSGVCLVGYSCYLNVGAVISQGVDLEFSGQILPGWQAQAGYTYNQNQYNKVFLSTYYGNGLNSAYTTQQPKHQLKLWTAYTPGGQFTRWTVGGGLRLESARSNVGYLCSVELSLATGACPSGIYVPYAFTQGLYAVLDLRVAYKLNDHWQAALNLTNVGDTRYYTTVGSSSGGNFYGEPRAFMFSVRASY